MFCAKVMLHSTLLRNYSDDSNFQTSELQGPHIKSNENFLLQLYCPVTDVILEAVELCKMRSLTTCTPHRMKHYLDE
jgi:hypothetical protein